MISPPYIPGAPCPCGLDGCAGSKLSSKTGHVARSCICPSCRNRRNVHRGKRAQANVHRGLGGVGFTPYHEESGRTYSLEVQIESKSGYQIPRSFAAFSKLDWTRHALGQAERAIPAGVQAYPALYLELPERGGRWLVVKVA
jgi:hypothetical protein